MGQPEATWLEPKAHRCIADSAADYLRERPSGPTLRYKQSSFGTSVTLPIPSRASFVFAPELVFTAQTAGSMSHDSKSTSFESCTKYMNHVPLNQPSSIWIMYLNTCCWEVVRGHIVRLRVCLGELGEDLDSVHVLSCSMTILNACVCLVGLHVGMERITGWRCHFFFPTIPPFWDH